MGYELTLPLIQNSFRNLDRETTTTRLILFHIFSNVHHDRTFILPDISEIKCSYSSRSTAVKKLLEYNWIQKVEGGRPPTYKILRNCELVDWKLWDKLNKPAFNYVGENYCLINRMNVESQYITNPGWVSDDEFQKFLDEIFTKVPGVIGKTQILEHLLKFEEQYKTMLRGEILTEFLIWNFEQYLQGNWSVLSAD